jgi:hypothetical protein
MLHSRLSAVVEAPRRIAAGQPFMGKGVRMDSGQGSRKIQPGPRMLAGAGACGLGKAPGAIGRMGGS